MTDNSQVKLNSRSQSCEGKITMDKEHKSVKTFANLWSEYEIYDGKHLRDREIDKDRMQSWSDNKLVRWLTRAIEHVPTSRPFIIVDAGCGLGYGFSVLLELLLSQSNESTLLRKNNRKFIYYGLDLIDLEKTEVFMQNFIRSHNLNFECRFINFDILNSEFTENYADLVVSLGSMHHTKSVETALQSTFSCLQRRGTYIGWIINKQKPLRAATDAFFRQHFGGLSLKECERELETLNTIFTSLGEALSDTNVQINQESKVLGLAAGKYKLQSLLYDYFLKCFYINNHSKQRHIHQLYDWFSPTYYEQTDRAQLEQYIGKIEGNSTHEIITKTNGHFFVIHRD